MPQTGNQTMTDRTIHLVLGDTAAGVLRDAMAIGTPETAPILRFRDIYCLGPLHALGTPDGPASRARYWAELLPDAPPTVGEFDEEEQRYRQAADAARDGTLFIWTGAHSSSQLWLRRLCAVLPPTAEDVRLVEAVEPGADARGRRAVSQFEPAEFGELLARTRVLDSAEIARLALEWQRNAAIASGVRRWVDGRVSHHGDDYYDGLLLVQCDDDWQPAGQAVGSAMWDCDEFLGDVFFAWRLRCLARSGRLLWRGPAESLDGAEVRLLTPGG
ncbi:hypothetical protein AZOA_09440 [Azoarcus sp. Aa7]|nr:hypothetical protein [Azoarcus sp. Aa7]